MLTLKTLFSQTMHMIFELHQSVCLTYICAGHEVYQIVVAVLTLFYMVCTIIKILFLVSSSVLSTHTLSHYSLTHTLSVKAKHYFPSHPRNNKSLHNLLSYQKHTTHTTCTVVSFQSYMCHDLSFVCTLGGGLVIISSTPHYSTLLGQALYIHV